MPQCECYFTQTATITFHEENNIKGLFSLETRNSFLLLKNSTLCESLYKKSGLLATGLFYQISLNGFSITIVKEKL